MTPNLQRDLAALLARFKPTRLARLLGVSVGCLDGWQRNPEREPRPESARRIAALAAEKGEPITYGQLADVAGTGLVWLQAHRVAPDLAPKWFERSTWAPRSAIRQLANEADGILRLQLRALLGGEADEQ